MAQELFYELRNRRVLVYDTDCLPLPGEEWHLRYLTQASLITGQDKDLGELLGRIISGQMEKIPRRVKRREVPTYEFRATPINRENQQLELPTVSGTYANPYYRATIEERI